MDSQQLLHKLRVGKERDQEVAFVIGGPNGVTSDFKAKRTSAGLCLFDTSHEMARVLLFEQLYRATRSFMVCRIRSESRPSVSVGWRIKTDNG